MIRFEMDNELDNLPITNKSKEATERGRVKIDDLKLH